MGRFARLAQTSLLAVLLVFLLCLPAPLAAIDFHHYDAMNDEQQTEYLVFMVDTMELAFRAVDHADLADQMEKLFTAVEPGDTMTLGMIELVSNVDRARVADAERHAREHDARRLDVEDALFVTLRKNNMEVTPEEMRSVLNAMKSYRWMTFADFLGLPPANQRRILTIDANWGFFNEMIYSELEDKKAGKQTAPDERHAIWLMERQVINDEFLSAGQPGFAKVMQQIADAYAKTPNDPGVLYTVVHYILSETDNRILAEMKKMEDSTYHLGDPTSGRQSSWKQLAELLKKLQGASH